jgi:hypothetical protein
VPRFDRLQRIGPDAGTNAGACSTPTIVRQTADDRDMERAQGGIYPSDPSIAGVAKGQPPGRLEGLEELVGLEKGAQRQCVYDAESQQQREYA